jgi:hypothetical protein
MTVTVGRISDSIQQLQEALQVTLASAAPDALQMEIRHTLREFCVRTNAWTSFLELTLRSGVRTYSITPSEGNAEVSTILGVAIDGRPISGWSGDYLPGPTIVNGSLYVTNEDQMVQSKLSSINLDVTSVTDANKKLTVTLGLRPKRNVLFLPDMLGFDHFDTLYAGVMARMLRHTARPYTDFDQAKYHHRMFKAGLTLAREKTRARFGKLTPPWTYPQMAPGRRYR